MLKKLLVASSFLLASQAMGQDVIKIGIEGSYPPFSYISENQTMEGFEPDLARLFCEKMNQKCEIVQVDFDALIPSLNTRRIDAILASMSITDTRKKAINFSNKYYQTPAKFVIPKGKTADVTDEGLKGKRIGVQSGTIHEIYMNDKYKRSADIRSYRNLDEAMMDLETGRIDLIFADVVALDTGYLQKDYGDRIEFIGPDFFEEEWFGEGVGVGVRKNDNALLERFNAAIKASREDGSYQAVEKKYFDYDVYGEDK